MNESFRIWDSKKKEFIYPQPRPENDGYAIGLNGKVVRMKGDFLTANNCDHLTPLFAVGVLDKNNKPAFLGDIYEDEMGKWLIGFDKAFCLIIVHNVDTADLKYGIRSDFQAKATIIGSVQANPELLKVKKKSLIIKP